MSSKYPEFKILHALTPVESENTLTYPRLDAAVQDYEATEPKLWNDFIDADHNSLEELDLAHRLAKLNLLRTAAAGINSADTIWQDRLVESSAEIYGDVDSDTWQFCVNTHLERIAEGDEKEQYTRLLSDIGVEVNEVVPGPEINPRWQQEFNARNKTLLELVPEKSEYKPIDIWNSTSIVMARLLSDDSEWSNWSVALKNNEKAIKVQASERQLIIGAEHSGKTHRSEVQELLAHELLTHVRRSVAGYSRGDYMVATGLPDYLDAEEGLATIAKTMCGTPLPFQALARYIDHGLVKGIAGKTISRDSLKNIVAQRHRALDPSLSDDQIQKKTRTYINRVYRGGTGNHPDATPQAMIMKDIVYVSGYIKMVEFINTQLGNGHDVAELWDYLHSGKFDPTNEAHVAYMNQIGVTL